MEEKPLAVAGTLIALRDDVFAKTYDAYSARDLPDFWMQSIEKVIAAAKLSNAKLTNMPQPFSGIQVPPSSPSPRRVTPRGCSTRS